MSRLLYAERKLSYLQRKYLLLGALAMVIGLIIAFFAISAVVSGEEFWRTLEDNLFYTLFIIVIAIIFALVVIPQALSVARFEIYDDKIVLPYPRKTSLFGPRKPDIILKKEIQKATLDYLEKGGAFRVKVPGEPDYGPKGEWRCIFSFKNGETSVLKWSDVGCEDYCVPALTEFIKGLEDDLSPYFP